MLQIIVFQLSALLWATTALSKNTGIQFTGAILAAVFVFLGLAQVSSLPPVP